MTESADRRAPPPRSASDKEVAGALVAGIGLVALVVIVLIAIASLPGAAKAQNIVAIATSAFGVIGAIVGAYFGVRAAKTAVDQSRENR
jgi:membrane associated rhomboid family serine protease